MAELHKIELKEQQNGNEKEWFRCSRIQLCFTCFTASLPSSSFSGTPCTRGSNTGRRNIQLSNLISISFGEDSLIDPTPTQRNAAEITNEARCHSQFWVCCTMCVLCWDTLLVLAWGTLPMLGTYLTLVLSLPCYKYRTSHRCCEGLTIRRLIAEENKKEALNGNHFGKMNPFSWCGRPFGVWILTDGPFRPVLYISKDEFTLEAEMSHLYLHLYRSNI